MQRYLDGAGFSPRRVRFVTSATSPGSGEQFVREQFARQVSETRRMASRMHCMLIVMMDADPKYTVRERHNQLTQQLEGAAPLDSSEPIFVLIAKRNVETWIEFALGRDVDEETDYKGTRSYTRATFRAAAQRLSELALAAEPPAVPDSLAQALPLLKRIRRIADV